MPISDKDMQDWLNFVKSNKWLPAAKPATKPLAKTFNKTLDLHELTVQEAYDSTLAYLAQHYKRKTRKVTIITGASGQIKNEFPGWAVTQAFKEYVQYIEQTNVGSFTVTIKKYNGR